MMKSAGVGWETAAAASLSFGEQVSEWAGKLVSQLCSALFCFRFCFVLSRTPLSTLHLFVNAAYA